MNCRVWTPSLFALTLLAPACSDDDAGGEGDSTEGSSGGTTFGTSTSTTDPSTTEPTGTTGSTTDPSTTDGTGETDGGTDGGSSGGETTGGAAKPDLGATPNVLCEASMVLFQTIIDENGEATPDATVIREAYLGTDDSGTALQDFVRLYGAWLGRVENAVLLDDQAILTALEDTPTAEELIDVETTIYQVVSGLIRERTGDVSAALPDVDRDPAILYAEWDDAYCYWDAVVRPLAQEADAEGIDTYLGSEEEIDAGFVRGHDGIEGEQPWAPDELEVPPAKQMVEKSTFRMWDRLIDKYAAAAEAGDDALAARRALGYFRVIEDRFSGKNTCGAEVIETMLTGDPAGIVAADIEDELNITWAKRTRRYTSHAIDDETVGTAEGYKGGIEGRTYVKTMVYEMGINVDDHMMVWDDWSTSILDDDFVAAQTASTSLTNAVCAYHTALGLPDCTTDDVGPCP